METCYFLGIDVSKKTIDAALLKDGKIELQVKVENSPKTIKSLFKQVNKDLKVPFSKLVVCLEHTGIYSNLLLDCLVKNEIKVCIEPALQIMKSQGMTRGKNDRIDAERIARYAYKNIDDLRFWKPEREVIQKIKSLLTLRDRLVKIKGQLEKPLHEAQMFIKESLRKNMISNCKQTLKGLLTDINKVEEQIKKTIEADTHLSDQVKWATSIPGVGNLTALNVIVSSGELEKISEVKKFACYAGVAPFEHSSGTSVRGKTRVSRMANMNMKRLLHLAAISAIQHCEDLKQFYERKVAEGKNKMSVINAVRNKLISRIFVCIKNKRMYTKNYQHGFAGS